MKPWKIVTILTLTIVGAALITASAYGMMGGFGAPFGAYNGVTTPYNTGYGYGGYGSMMGGYGYGGYGGYGYYPATTVQNATANTTLTTPTYPYGYGGYGGFDGCGGDYGGYAYASTYANGATGTELNITQAEAIAENYLASLNNPNLAVKEIEQYSLNYYVQYYEKNTGIGAFEMLINPYTGAITPEPGPNMMWNTKYGMMAGIMGIFTSAPTANMPVNASQAKVDAQLFLNGYMPGATVGEVVPFYGYYHVMVQVNGSNVGMLSLNGYTGQAWYHTWHGTFIQELDLT